MITALKTIGYAIAFLLTSGIIVATLLKWKRRRACNLTKLIKDPGHALPIVGHVWLLWGKPENVIPTALYWYTKWSTDNFRVWVAHRVFVVITKAEDYALTLGSAAFTKKVDEYSGLADSVMGQGLFTATDLSEWRKNRKLITPAFHFQILKSFIGNFYTEVKTLADILWQRMEEIGEVEVLRPMGLATLDMITQNAMGVSINAQNNHSHPFIRGLETAIAMFYYRLFTPWILTELVFNVSPLKTAQEKAKRDVQCFAMQVILNKVEDWLNSSISRNGCGKETDPGQKKNDPYQVKQTRVFLDLLIEKAYAGVDERRMRRLIARLRRQNENKEEQSFLSDLLKKMSPWLNRQSKPDFWSNLFDTFGPRWAGVNGSFRGSKKGRSDLGVEDDRSSATDEKDAELEQITRQLLDEVVTIFLGGHDTTAGESSFAMLMLALHQQVQSKVVSEQEEIFGKDCRAPSYEDLQRMEYLESVIQETMRLYPALVATARDALNDVTLSDKTVIPKGTSAIFFIYGLHRDPQYYPNPSEFIPERFLGEKGRNRHPYSFVPFSAGPRNCIGQKYAMLQMKITLSTLVRRFRFQPSPKMPSKESMKLIAITTLRPTRGCWVRIEKRL